MTPSLNASSTADSLTLSMVKNFVPFEHLSDQQLAILLQQAVLEHVHKGQTVVKIGDSAQQHIYLLQGVLSLTDSEGETLIDAADNAARQAIAHHFPRKAYVLAETDAMIFRLESKILEDIVCWGQVSRCLLADIAQQPRYSEDYFWIQSLMSSRLFQKVPPTNITDVLDKFEPMHVDAGQSLIEQGDIGDYCYLLKAGVAEVYIDDSSVNGKKLVASLTAGDIFGEDALVSNKPRNATVIMLGDGVLMRLHKKDFIQLLRKPEVTEVTPGNLERFVETGAELIDVRTQSEFDLGHFQAAINLPLHLCLIKSAMLDSSKQYITYASSDERARAAAVLLQRQGFNVYVLQGGITALSAQLIAKFSAAKADA